MTRTTDGFDTLMSRLWLYPYSRSDNWTTKHVRGFGNGVHGGQIANVCLNILIDTCL